MAGCLDAIKSILGFKPKTKPTISTPTEATPIPLQELFVERPRDAPAPPPASGWDPARHGETYDKLVAKSRRAAGSR